MSRPSPKTPLARLLAGTGLRNGAIAKKIGINRGVLFCYVLGKYRLPARVWRAITALCSPSQDAVAEIEAWQGGLLRLRKPSFNRAFRHVTVQDGQP